MSSRPAGAVRHAEHVMGTVFSVTVRDPGPCTGAALEQVVARLHAIDAVFSPYRADSDISRLDRGEAAVEDCHPDVARVLARCRETAGRTGGWFTERPAGRLDPSGWVKGWAVEEACRRPGRRTCPSAWRPRPGHPAGPPRRPPAAWRPPAPRRCR
ncbi:FAD:protein FMN transferase [Kitasatospora sp. NPDC088346]|uniref:FAD:protein FMN transferase n=1 Tax=Kitasatospora sp. NPDC088346 TaxID=3364073 RepID=UPI003801F0DC